MVIMGWVWVCLREKYSSYSPIHFNLIIFSVGFIFGIKMVFLFLGFVFCIKNCFKYKLCDSRNLYVAY